MPPFDATPPDRALPKPRRARRSKSKGALVSWLAARIVEHLKGLGIEPGAHITEQGLADHFQVSRTPVRLALGLLAEAGAVEHRANRGYFLAQAPAAVAGSEVAAPDKDDKLYYRIAEDRLAGRIPQRVTETELVRRYRTSRTRVSSLLARMAQEGWLERLPGHGWAFQPMLDSVKGYEDGYRFRAVIEPAALLQPGYHLPPEAIARCRQQQLDLLQGGLLRYADAEVFEIGATLHETIVSGSGNAFFIDAIRRVNALRRLLEYRAKRSRETIVRQCTEHLELLDLLEAGKYAKAARFMQDHLDVARETKSALVGAVARKRGK
jgi:DNA-binding GntR family transcriptional regulator